MKRIIPLMVAVTFWIGCPSRIVKVQTVGQCPVGPPITGCKQIQDQAKSCKIDLDICQLEKKRWAAQSASRDVELDAMENPK